jgi:hypothetical protein
LASDNFGRGSDECGLDLAIQAERVRGEQRMRRMGRIGRRLIRFILPSRCYFWGRDGGLALVNFGRASGECGLDLAIQAERVRGEQRFGSRSGERTFLEAEPGWIR